MTGLTFEEAARWREDVAEDLEAAGIECYSPLRGKHFLKGSTILNAYREEVLGQDKAIVSRDRWDVQRADVVLMNLFNGDSVVSIGSMVELGWADAARKVIVTVMQKPEAPDPSQPGVGGNRNIHDHAFVRALSSFVVPTLEDAVDLIITLNKQGGGA